MTLLSSLRPFECSLRTILGSDSGFSLLPISLTEGKGDWMDYKFDGCQENDTVLFRRVGGDMLQGCLPRF